jgi:NAD(P)-dependent dehydrogenase (short-subunit alcohol dehydrogenase family)
MEHSEKQHSSGEGNIMFHHMHRRGFLKSTSAFAAASMLPSCISAGITDINDIPVSDFGVKTTADEVMAGIDLTGKTALITGVNSGIGYETMRVMAEHGAHVIGAARTMEKAETACNSVQGSTTPVVCELTDFNSIVACTDTVADLDTPIDMLICNAGIMALPKLEQVNGIEKQFVVNHLGHFILTRRLLPQVEAAPAGNITMVSSIGYRNAPKAGIEFDNLSGERAYSGFKMYGQTKLANALFSRELAKRYRGTATTSNSLHPGMVKTNLGRYFMPKRPAGSPASTRPPRLDMKTPNQGAATTAYVAAHPNIKGVNGFYFEDCNPVEPVGPHMHDEALAKKLWDVSEELTKDYLA